MPSVIWGADNQSISSGLKKMSDIYNQRIKPQYLKTIEKNKHILPLTRIIEKLNKTGTVGDNNFFIFEEDEIPQSVQLLASQPTTTDTDLVMTASDMIKAIKVGHIMQCPRTGEQFTIEAVNYATYTLSVTRGHGGSTPTALLINDYFQIFSMSDTDGNTAPSGTGVEPKKVTNYLQIAKKTIEVTGRMQNADTYQGGNEMREWEKMLVAFEQEQEKAYLFGLLSSTGRVTTGGLKYWISTNLVDASAGMTETVLEAFLQKVYRFNQGKKLIFLAGENLMAWLQKFGKDRLEYAESDVVPGVMVTRFRSLWGGGASEFIPHGMMTSNYDGGLTYAGYCFAVNPELVGKVAFRGREMQYLKGKQTPDLDGIKNYVLSDFGLYLGNERSHGLMYGISNPYA